MSNEQTTPSSPGFLQRAFSAVASPELWRYGLLTVAPGALGAACLAAGVDPKIVLGAQSIAAAGVVVLTVSGAAAFFDADDVVVTDDVVAAGFSSGTAAVAVGAAAVGAAAVAVGVAVGVVSAVGVAAVAAKERGQEPKRAAGGAGTGTLAGAALMAFTMHAYAPDFLKPEAATTPSAVSSTFSVEKKGPNCAGLRTGDPVELENGDRLYVLRVPAGCQERNP